uniref:tRNA/rRNA methyltransferase SpoU type domain-containing protein n=1 Tax=Chenopodium quinoa TaxID=63459 RepID=A0A803NEG1_CHEQI
MRFRDNRHVSMGSEKWLDLEVWNSTRDCFNVLKSRGYRIATTHLGIDTVSIYDMDWSCPTAIVVGNENRGISEEALEFSDLHCSIPMNGMVDSFNVSVAAGILMHHAVFDRTSRMVSLIGFVCCLNSLSELDWVRSSTRHGLNPDFVDLEGQLTHEAPREDEKDLESGLEDVDSAGLSLFCHYVASLRQQDWCRHRRATVTSQIFST